MSHDPIQRKHEEEANQKGGYGDARKGAELFRKWCSHCHSLNPVEGHGIGPNLAGIVERDIAYSKDYRYSASMKYFYITWTNENLNAFLRSPRRFIPGNKMEFKGLPRDQDRYDIIEYLQNR